MYPYRIHKNAPLPTIVTKIEHFKSSSSMVASESSYVNRFFLTGKGMDFLPHLPESLHFICTATSPRL